VGNSVGPSIHDRVREVLPLFFLSILAVHNAYMLRWICLYRRHSTSATTSHFISLKYIPTIDCDLSKFWSTLLKLRIPFHCIHTNYEPSSHNQNKNWVKILFLVNYYPSHFLTSKPKLNKMSKSGLPNQGVFDKWDCLGQAQWERLGCFPAK